MNLELTEEEFESVVDMCIMAITIVQHVPNSDEDRMRMNNFFNKLLSLKPNREEIVTDARFDRIQTTFFYPYLDRFKELLDEDAQQGVDVIAQPVVAEDVEEVGEASEAEVVTNNFWGRL